MAKPKSSGKKADKNEGDRGVHADDRHVEGQSTGASDAVEHGKAEAERLK